MFFSSHFVARIFNYKYDMRMNTCNFFLTQIANGNAQTNKIQGLTDMITSLGHILLISTCQNIMLMYAKENLATFFMINIVSHTINDATDTKHSEDITMSAHYIPTHII